MSFDMKYNRDGEVIKQDLPEQIQQEPEQSDATRDVLSQLEDPAPVQAVEQESAAQPEEVVEDSKQKRNSSAHNLSVLREKAEQAEKRALEAERLLQQYANTQPKISESIDEDLNLSVDDDSLVEGKHLSKVAKKIQNLERQLKQYEQQSTLSATEMQLKAKYPDFDSIVSSENLANLKAIYPEMAHTINSSNDLYSKAVTAYTMIKKLGISESVEEYRVNAEAVKKNAAKPKSLASIAPQQGDSPLSKANAFANGTLTDDIKKALLKEMYESRR